MNIARVRSRLRLIGWVAIAAAIAGACSLYYATAFAEGHVIKMFDMLEVEESVDAASASQIAGFESPPDRFVFARKFLLGDGHALRLTRVTGYSLCITLLFFGAVCINSARCLVNVFADNDATTDS